MLLFKMRKIVAIAGLFFTLWAHAASSAYAGQALCSMHDGQPADGKTVLEKQGKKYEFCCSGCLKQFKDAPAKFADELQSPLPTAPVSAEATCSTVCSD